MNSKFSQFAYVVGVICSLGVTINSAAAKPGGNLSLSLIGNHDGTRQVILERAGNGVALALSFSEGNQLSMTAYISKATVQTEVAMAQYNSAFAANYAQGMAKRQWVAAQNSPHGLQVATSRPSIQCQTNSGPAKSLCDEVQIALKP